MKNLKCRNCWKGYFFRQRTTKYSLKEKIWNVDGIFVKDDLQSQQRVDPLNFVSYNANAREKALYNFYLLNLPTKTLLKYNEVSSEYERYNNTVKSLSEKVKADTGKDIQEFRTERLKIEKTLLHSKAA